MNDSTFIVFMASPIIWLATSLLTIRRYISWWRTRCLWKEKRERPTNDMVLKSITEVRLDTNRAWILANIQRYYSTNCNTIQIWSWCSRYLSSVGDRYPAIYVASYVGRKSEVKKCRQNDLKMLRAVLLSICWIIKQLSCSISRNIVWF